MLVNIYFKSLYVTNGQHRINFTQYNICTMHVIIAMIAVYAGPVSDYCQSIVNMRFISMWLEEHKGPTVLYYVCWPLPSVSSKSNWSTELSCRPHDHALQCTDRGWTFWVHIVQADPIVTYAAHPHILKVLYLKPTTN